MTSFTISTSIPPNKNTKKVLNVTTGFMQRTQYFKDFMEEMDMYRINYSKDIEAFTKQWKKGLLIQLIIQVYQSTQRTDHHNLSEVLMDGIEKMIGINDKYFVPIMLSRLYAKEGSERVEVEMKVILDPWKK
jgi:hypothetical protein